MSETNPNITQAVDDSPMSNPVIKGSDLGIVWKASALQQLVATL